MSVEIVLAWVVLLVLLAYAIAGRTREWLRFRDADAWPLASVSSIGYISIDNSDDDFTVETVCVFKTDGRIYTTTLRKSFGSRRKAEQFGEELAAGLPLQVRFNPEDPDTSRVELASPLEPESQSSVVRKAG